MPRVSITIPGKNSQPYRFKLDRDKVSIGRSSDNDIIIDDPSVSSLHCTMERVEGGYILRDRNSTNGMRLNEDEMAIIDLRNDSDIRIGDVQFDYSLTEEELDDLDDEEFTPRSKKLNKEETESKSDEKSKSKNEKSKEKSKSKVVTTPAPNKGPTAPPVLASSTQGGGFAYGLALLVCGLLAFFAGLSNSYSGKQKSAGREGEYSLFSDIRDGRPPMPEKSKDEE